MTTNFTRTTGWACCIWSLHPKGQLIEALVIHLFQRKHLRYREAQIILPRRWNPSPPSPQNLQGVNFLPKGKSFLFTHNRLPVSLLMEETDLDHTNPTPWYLFIEAGGSLPIPDCPWCRFHQPLVMRDEKLTLLGRSFRNLISNHLRFQSRNKPKPHFEGYSVIRRSHQSGRCSEKPVKLSYQLPAQGAAEGSERPLRKSLQPQESQEGEIELLWRNSLVFRSARLLHLSV